jgi:glycosyltransferase involved in cell wall biosynthesis
MRALTWHVHGAYLYYLSHVDAEIFVPVKPGRPEGYGGRCGTLAWPENLKEVPAGDVRSLEFDCILFQSAKNYREDQFEILTEAQRCLPRIYLEHDPPRENPTGTRHIVDDPNVLLVHCTPFNALMWDSGRTPVRVIDHGVKVPDDVTYTGELAKGLVIVNCMQSRGRRLGADIFERVRKTIPLDLVGMKSEELGGLGEIRHDQLPALIARYRFLFNPIRYTSMGLAVCEAMMTGVPVIGLATTEMSTAVENGVSGYVDTNIDNLIAHMKRLLENPEEARRLGAGARRKARDRFGLARFIRDWNQTLEAWVAGHAARDYGLKRQPVAGAAS